ncbi:MAG TPA: hypothetical protein VK157_08180 [Phycisphaerales bacterium]|nr:hypothetical protein [Phycisphaerales bacterium]
MLNQLFRSTSTCAIMAGLLSGIAATNSNAQNLLVNGSFEDPVVPSGFATLFTSGQSIGSAPGTWIVASAQQNAAVIDDLYTGGGAIWANPTDGRQFLYVGDIATSSTIYQDFLVTAPGAFRLTFDMANFLASPSNFPNGARLRVDILQGSTSILPGGQVQFDRPRNAGFAPQSLDMTFATSGTYRLIFTNETGFGTNVDNFVLQPVPTPGSALASMAVLYAATRRRRR